MPNDNNAPQAAGQQANQLDPELQMAAINATIQELENQRAYLGTRCTELSRELAIALKRNQRLQAEKAGLSEMISGLQKELAPYKNPAEPELKVSEGPSPSPSPSPSV